MVSMYIAFTTNYLYYYKSFLKQYNIYFLDAGKLYYYKLRDFLDLSN